MSKVYGFILLLAIGCLIYLGRCYLRELQLKEAARDNENDRLFIRKLVIIQQREQRRHVFRLMDVTCLILVILFLFVGTQWRELNKLKSKEAEITLLEHQVAHLTEEQAAILNMPIYDYPKEGIELEGMDWTSLLINETPSTRFEIEEELARRSTPFLGPATVIVTNNIPIQRITLTIYSELTEGKKLETIQRNLNKLIDEAEEVEEISQVNLQVRQRGKEVPLLNEVYLRNETGKLEILTEKEETEKEGQEGKDDPQIEESAALKDVEQKGAVTGNDK